jgi:hypothetical protein
LLNYCCCCIPAGAAVCRQPGTGTYAVTPSSTTQDNRTPLTAVSSAELIPVCDPAVLTFSAAITQ